MLLAALWTRAQDIIIMKGGQQRIETRIEEVRADSVVYFEPGGRRVAVGMGDIQTIVYGNGDVAHGENGGVSQEGTVAAKGNSANHLKLAYDRNGDLVVLNADGSVNPRLRYRDVLKTEYPNYNRRYNWCTAGEIVGGVWLVAGIVSYIAWKAADIDDGSNALMMMPIGYAVVGAGLLTTGIVGKMSIKKKVLSDISYSAGLTPAGVGLAINF